jgi:hypothetical protein
MKEYNDAVLNELIDEGRRATIRLSYIKVKKQTPEMKELLIFRRNRLSLIRQRATELRLTEADLERIHDYVQMRTP